ncbi:MAG: hypothetical protein RMK57_01010 [Bryobacterales bacterium]|nr:hypothetical protein [Bryobacteraceae bacterium]MDW8353083.1 hypothetical protein [Bryobacterales bacterium]
MRLPSASLLLAGWLAAQSTVTVAQLEQFVRSSIELRHPDRKVAEYVKKLKLSERLEERTIIELQAAGAGPRTVEALRTLQQASRHLPPARRETFSPEPPAIPPPSRVEQLRILESVRDYALNYVRRLPDFICTQVTRRYVDPTGLEFWQQQDTLTARLTYFEQKEEYKLLLVNGVLTNQPYESLGGATSTGEFGSLMREIFEPATETAFRWERWATLRGRRVHVFSYRVEQPRSKWRVSYERTQEITPAYQGLIYVDSGTLMVMRITLEAVEIPPSFPIQQASTVLDYDYTNIGGREYMLPLRAVVRMRRGKFLTKNEVEFRLYRKFEAEATITFDTPEPLPEEKVVEQPAKP